MSRIGNRIITVPAGVTVTEENGFVKVTGPKGTLEQKMLNKITMKQDANIVALERADESAKANHGTMNSLITNMIKGVTEGYSKSLEIVGVGYNFKPSGSVLTIKAGYSHPVEMKVPQGITVEAVSNTEITIKGIDKAQVGKFAAEVKKVRKPEPYKGKGIRIKGEHIIRKEGKKAAK